uniref:Probable ATP-dependent transporter ycf16 n=1 Tax=Compsopogon caeruleus TaxID=31354 RepID=A0A7S1TGE9_9RHOD
MQFFKNLWEFLRICIPGVRSVEFFMTATTAVLLVSRSYLDIWTSENGGEVVKAIVGRDKQEFLRRAVRDILMMMFPIAAVNALLKYSLSLLKTMMRKKLSLHFHDSYLANNTFYKVTNLDHRMRNIDQLLTTDVERFCTSLADLYSNLSKPLLDVILFSVKLARSLGTSGPAIMIGYFGLASVILRFVQPPFGKLAADEQRLEGEYRLYHSRLIAHSEEIAFYRGGIREKLYINIAFERVVKHLHKIFGQRLYIGFIDSILVKYIATAVGYCVVSIPVFFVAHVDGETASDIAGVYTRNSRLLLALAGAIGRLVLAGKEVNRLTGYCARVADLREVLQDFSEMDPKKRTSRLPSSKSFQEELRLANAMKPGELVIGSDHLIRFEHVNIVSPDRTILVEDLSFEICRGTNLLITGPNGCGKSSSFRVLAGLWPLYGGKLTRPDAARTFYVPQRPYLALGTLRDQVTYPLVWREAQGEKGATDEMLLQLLEDVYLSEVAKRKGGLDAEHDWSDVLSGGEKQRLAMARLFFHRPAFAILDECTSAVSMDVEDFLYTRAKELGTSLITISHRFSIWKHHEKLLRFDGMGGYEFRDITEEDIPPQTPMPSRKGAMEEE